MYIWLVDWWAAASRGETEGTFSSVPVGRGFFVPMTLAADTQVVTESLSYQLCDSIRSCIHLKHAITEAWFLIVIGNTPQICSLIAESEAYGMKMEPHHSTLLVEIGRLGSYGNVYPN